MIVTLFSGFSESYKISSCKCRDLESVILLTVNEASVKRRCSLGLEIKLKWQSLALGITQLNSCKLCLKCTWISVGSQFHLWMASPFFSELKATQTAVLVLMNSWYSSTLTSAILGLRLFWTCKNLIQGYRGSYLHIFVLAGVGKIQSCQILPVGYGLCDTADTVWWSRLLGGLKTEGTFGWTPGGPRADIQLAPSSEQGTQDSRLGSTLLDIFRRHSLPSLYVLMVLN